MPIVYPLRRPVAPVLGAVILLAACAAFLVLLHRGALAGSLGLVLGVAAAGLAAAAVLALHNLLRHEGWAVVLGDEALELPGAPVQSRHRDRIPYRDITLLALTPPPPATPEVLVVQFGPDETTHWIRREDLIEGDLVEIACALEDRVRLRRGPGRPFRTA